MMTLSGVTSTPTTLVMAASSGAGGAATTTVLSSAQATQLLQRLQHSQGGVGGVLGGAGGHTIKIQAVQTHPQTGVRQIIAIPIHTTSAPAATHATPGKFQLPINQKVNCNGGPRNGVYGINPSVFVCSEND